MRSAIAEILMIQGLVGVDRETRKGLRLTFRFITEASVYIGMAYQQADLPQVPSKHIEDRPDDDVTSTQEAGAKCRSPQKRHRQEELG